jgi:hypothetical protein
MFDAVIVDHKIQGLVNILAAKVQIMEVMAIKDFGYTSLDLVVNTHLPKLENRFLHSNVRTFYSHFVV